MTHIPLEVFNQQPTEHIDHDDGSALDVIEIYHTIQGEGPFVGWPAVFVRLAGCTLQCPLCDTNYTEGRNRIETLSLVTAIRAATRKNTKLVVITGGEPFRQTIGPFVKELINCGYKVQIETNGTVYDESMKVAWFNPALTIVCSPKTKVHHLLYPHISCYKYVLSADRIDVRDGLPTHVLGLNTRPDRPHSGFFGRVYVQPADVSDYKMTFDNITTCVNVCQEFGYILSVQVHKVVRIP